MLGYTIKEIKWLTENKKLQIYTIKNVEKVFMYTMCILSKIS